MQQTAKGQQKRTFNHIVNAALVLITAWGSFTNGWFNLPNLMSWLGIIGVILIAYGRQENFIFNLAQNVLNVIVSGGSRLFGDMVMAIYYAVTQLFGIDIWRRNRDSNGELVTDKTTDWTVVVLAILIGGVGLGVFSWWLGGAFIILDAFNNSTAIVAQYLQIIKRKRSGWLLWGATNAVGIIIWAGVGQPQVAIMYFVFAINSLRGYLNWSD